MHLTLNCCDKNYHPSPVRYLVNSNKIINYSTPVKAAPYLVTLIGHPMVLRTPNMIATHPEFQLDSSPRECMGGLIYRSKMVSRAPISLHPWTH